MNSGKLASTGCGAASSHSLRTSAGRRTDSSAMPWQASTSRARECFSPAVAVMNPSSACGLVVEVGARIAFGGVSIICSASRTGATKLSHVTTAAARVSSRRVASEELAVPLATA
eukprot:3321021-Prymnesium_polylepis.1